MQKTGTITLETHRLMLRQFRIEDAEDMFANWASDPEVTKFLTWPPHESVEATRTLLSEWSKDYEKPERSIPSADGSSASFPQMLSYGS